MAARVEALAKAAVAAARTPYIDSWYHRTLEEPELNLPVLAGGEEEADVCVVGGGLAGPRARRRPRLRPAPPRPAPRPALRPV